MKKLTSEQIFLVIQALESERFIYLQQLDKCKQSNNKEGILGSQYS